MGWIDWIKENIVTPTYDNVIKPVYDNVIVPVYDYTYPVISIIFPAMDKNNQKIILDALQKAGLVVGDGFVNGVNLIHSGLGDEIKEAVNEGWSKTKDFYDKNSCQIEVSVSLSTILAEFIPIGIELEMSEKASLIAAQKSTDSDTKDYIISQSVIPLAKILSEPIYLTKGLEVSTKEDLESAIAFLLFKSMSGDNKNIASYKDLFSGALVMGITSYVCDGSLPSGYTDWKKKYYY